MLRVRLQQKKSKISRISNDQNFKPKKCLVCDQNFNRIDKTFGSCNHKGVCVNCAEMYMISRIKQKKSIVCMVDPECGAEMSQVDGALFFYMKQSSKEMYRKYKNNQEVVFPNCQMPDCPGVIIHLRCVKCGKYYCEMCGRFAHTLYQSCEQSAINRNSIQLKIDGLTFCPNCKQQYQKQQGCNHMTCTKCKHQFCNVCKQNWDKSHHMCISPKPQHQHPVSCCQIM